MTIMREVVVSDMVRAKIAALNSYLSEEFQLSREAAMFRIKRMEDFVETLANPADYPLCRFKRWRVLGYRCVVFEKSWIFAYEIFDGGIIVRDMSHATVLVE